MSTSVKWALSALVEDPETAEYRLADITIGMNFASHAQKKHGTWLFFEENSQTYCIMTQNPGNCYFRVYSSPVLPGHSRQRVLAHTTSLEELLPYFYLYFRHLRGDTGFEHRRRLFDRIETLDKTEDEIKVDQLMVNIYGQQE
jgi:hypothetical protein